MMNNQLDKLMLIKKTSKLLLMTCVGWSGLMLFSNQALAANTGSAVANTSEPAASQSQAPAQATTGDWNTVTWNWNASNGTLTLSPKTGNSGTLGTSNTAPWNTTPGVDKDSIEAIDIKEGVAAPENGYRLFWGFPNLKAINGLTYLNVDDVTNMNEMFSSNPKLETLDVSNFDTKNVTYMGSMFSYLPKVRRLNVSNFDTQKVKSMEGMFYNDPELFDLDVSNFVTDEVTSTSAMFYNDNNLPDQNFTKPGKWNTEKVKRMYGMFSGDDAIEHLDLSNFNTSQLTSIGSMFQDMPHLQTLNLETFNTSKITSQSDKKDVFLNDDKLWSLRIGSDFHLDKDAALTEAPGNNTPMPDESDYVNSEPYWVPLDGGTEHNPLGPKNTYDAEMVLANADNKTETYVWQQEKSVTPTPNPSPTPTPTPTPTPSNPSWNPTTPSKPNDSTGLNNYAGVEKSAVYATKAIYMYQQPTFKKSQRIAKYPKTSRTNRPMFVITGYDKSNNGVLRLKVRDVNHNRQSDGKTGYITANNKFVTNVYYKSMPKQKQITVISKNGIRSYKNLNLTKRSNLFKKGTHLRVQKLVKHNLTTRYELSNGHYITANKKFIIQGNY